MDYILIRDETKLLYLVGENPVPVDKNQISIEKFLGPHVHIHQLLTLVDMCVYVVVKTQR